MGYAANSVHHSKELGNAHLAEYDANIQSVPSVVCVGRPSAMHCEKNNVDRGSRPACGISYRVYDFGSSTKVPLKVPNSSWLHEARCRPFMLFRSRL